jgi:hypothetical protein
MSAEYLMILNDGDTYTDLSGCKIIRVDEEALSDDQGWNLENGYIGALISAAEAGDDEGVEVVLEFKAATADGLGSAPRSFLPSTLEKRITDAAR